MFDINRELRDIDRKAERVSRRLEASLLTRASRSIRLGTLELRDEDLSQALYASVHKAMLEAHFRGREAARREKALWKASRFALAKPPPLLRPGTPKEARSSISKLYSAIARTVTGQTMTKLRDSLLGEVQQLFGERPSKYRPSLKSKAKASGAVGPAVKTVVRTQTALAFNAAAWAENDEDDEVWGFQYSTAGDERVRPEHEVLDGTAYPKGHKFWETAAPPNGWNCRCTLETLYVGDSDAKTVPFKGTPEIDPAFKFNMGTALTRPA